MLCLIVAWLIVRRMGADFWTMAARVLAWAADKAGAVAKRFEDRLPTAATQTRAYAARTAEKLRDRPSPTAPRTAAGQDLLAGLGGITVTGFALVFMWVQVLSTDAVAAAHAAQERRAPDAPWWTGWKNWRWPEPDEPGAPVRATAERIDPEAIEPPHPESDQPIDAEIVEPTSSEDTTEPTAAEPTGEPMTLSAFSSSQSSAPVGEGSLGSYLGFARHCVEQAEIGINSTEATLNDMAAHGWGGERVDTAKHAMELLGNAKLAFEDWVRALEGSLSVTDSYSANEGTGDKETVTNV